MTTVLHIQSMDHNISAFLKLLAEKSIRSVLFRNVTVQDIEQSDVILIDGHSDQRALAGFAAELEQHLISGGTIVFNGHLTYPVFAGLQSFQVAAGRGIDDLMIERVNDHPIFRQVDCQDISVRRGVAGFYGRGANPPPEGAIVLHRLIKDKSAIDWVWQRPNGGQIFMHSGNNMWMYASDNTSARHIAPQLLEWTLCGAPYNY